MNKKNLRRDEELFNGLVTVWGNDIILHPYSGEAKNNYKDNVLKLNDVIDALFKEKVDVLIKKASDLKEEKSRLEKMIDLLDKYRSRKEKIKQDYLRIVSEPLMDVSELEVICSYDDLEYRLNTINNYMESELVLEKTREDLYEHQNNLHSLKEQLIREENNNLLLEQKLSNYLCLTFGNQGVSKEDYEMLCDIEKITKEIIDNDLERFNKDVLYKDSRRDINLSIMEEKNNYLSYITKIMFYQINDLMVVKDHEYSALLNKRIKIINLIEERKQILSNYNIIDQEKDVFDLVEFVNDQLLLLDSQKHILDEINSLEKKIDSLNDKIYEYNKKLNDENVLKVVNEYINPMSDSMPKYDVDTSLPLLDDVDQNENILVVNDWEKKEILFDEGTSDIAENSEKVAFEPIDNIVPINIYNDLKEENSEADLQLDLAQSGDVVIPGADIASTIDKEEKVALKEKEIDHVNISAIAEDEDNGSLGNDVNATNSVVLPKDEVMSNVSSMSVVTEKVNNPKIVSITNPKFLVDYKRTNDVIVEISKMLGIEKNKNNSPLAILSADDTQELYDMLGGNI